MRSGEPVPWPVVLDRLRRLRRFCEAVSSEDGLGGDILPLIKLVASLPIRSAGFFAWLLIANLIQALQLRLGFNGMVRRREGLLRLSGC